MDVRHPTHELTRAAAALKARRTAMARKAPWPLSIDGLSALRGIGGVADETPRSKGKRPDPDDDAAYPPHANDADPWTAHFAEIDALLDRTSKVLAGETPLRKSRSHLVYDPDQDEAESEDVWLDLVQRTSPWPAVAAASVAWQAWLDLNLYTRQPWLGLIMAAAILRARGLTSHLLPLAAGFKQSKFRPQGREGAKEKLDGFCQVIEEALTVATKDLDRLILARELMARVAAKTRSNSKLPQMVELFLSRPLVTVLLGAKYLKDLHKAMVARMAKHYPDGALWIKLAWIDKIPLAMWNGIRNRTELGDTILFAIEQVGGASSRKIVNARAVILQAKVAKSKGQRECPTVPINAMKNSTAWEYKLLSSWPQFDL